MHLLSDQVQELPLSPGVYLMKDRQGHIIYIGKAKQLRRRVQSYFRPSTPHSPKVKRLVKHIHDLEHICTDTEFEAFMLECRMIKEWKPLYNKKMKNPLAYSYIVITSKSDLRQIEVTYEPAKDTDRANYDLSFGPYTSRSTVERAVQGLKEAYRMLCSHPQGKSSAPCLNYSLGLCIGVCTGGEAVEQYNAVVDRFIALLSGVNDDILSEMEQMMNEAAARYDFEQAAKIRDYITAIQALLQKERVMKFAAANRRIAVLEPISEGISKLLLLQGSRLLCGIRLMTDGSSHAELFDTVRAAVLQGFGAERLMPAAMIGRHEIDEAQIIYSYLQSSTCRHVLIPEEGLSPGGEAILDDTLHELLDLQHAAY